MEPAQGSIERAGLVGPERLLTERELVAYRWIQDHPQPELSPDTQSRLFGLFLNGTDCVRIALMNRGISLAQIVRSRIEGKWDERREEHVSSLLDFTHARVQQTTLEAIDFVADQLAAAHKLHGEKLKKFLMTGDAADLGGFSIHGFKGYKESIDLLKSLTGQDAQKKDVRGEVLHRHVVEGRDGQDPPPAQSARTLNSAQASALVKSALSRLSLPKDAKDEGKA